MNCNCPFADQCLHSTKPTPGWVQFGKTMIVVGAAIGCWRVLFVLGRLAWFKAAEWGWM